MDLKVECGDCQKRFQFEESLVVHQSVCQKHNDTRSRRPYSCEQCGKSFKSMTSLRNHARTHNDYFDITKDLFDQTMRSGLDSTLNILESTRSSEADTSTLNRSLDISAVMCTDTSTNVTYTYSVNVPDTTLNLDTTRCIDTTNIVNPTNTLNIKTIFDTGKNLNTTTTLDTPKITESTTPTDTNTDDSPASSPDRTITEESKSKQSTTFSVQEKSSSPTIADTTTTVTSNTKQDQQLKDDTMTKAISPSSSSSAAAAATFIRETVSNQTYVFDKTDRDSARGSIAAIGLDKTYVCDGSRRLSADRTYLVPSPQHDNTVTDSGNVPMDTTHVISHHVTSNETGETRRRSGIPVSILGKPRLTVNATQKTTTTATTTTQGRPSPSVKSIRTLRNSRSRSRTPVKGDKNRSTPNKSQRPKSRGQTPLRTKRTSKYAVRITSYNGTDYMRADSPFRLTPLSPKVTPGSKTKSTNSSKYKCQKCGKVFLDKDQYDIHYVIHVRDTPVKCGVPADCFKKNNRKLQFGTPDKTTTTTQKPAAPSHVCPHCQRAYQSEQFLKSHMKIHYIDVPFACTHCDKRFKYQQSLRAHAITHVGEESKGQESIESTKSSECNKRNSIQLKDVLGDMKFSDKLLGNLDNNTDIRAMLDMPYTCNSCSYKTNQPGDLLKHMQTHSRPRPFKCSECEKSYKTRANLELHSKVHMIGKIKTLLKDRRNSIGPKVFSRTSLTS